MKEIVLWIRQNTNWLYVKIFENKLFFFDYWSFVHFTSGILLYSIFINFKKKWLIIISLLILYELVEILTIYFALNVFKPETIKDQFTDIIVGILGAYFQMLLLKYFNKFEKNIKDNFLQNYSIIFISIQISFWWVGSYGYKHNFKLLNTAGLNIITFLIWFISLFFIYKIYDKIKAINTNKVKSFIITYLIYLISLFIYEYITYNFLGIKEIGHKNKSPLLFDLIHGTIVLHLVYLLMPLILLSGYKIFYKLLTKTTIQSFYKYSSGINFLPAKPSNKP